MSVTDPQEAVARLIDDTDSEEAANAIRSFVIDQVTHKQALEWMFEAVQVRPDIFPRMGYVAGSGSYYYLRIPDGTAYIKRIPSVLSVIEAAYGIENLTSSGTPYRHLYTVHPPPSPAGAHITLGDSLPQKSIGHKVEFQLDCFSYYGDGKAGKKPSGFRSELYPYRWYVLYVIGVSEDLRELAPDYNDKPHISVGVGGMVHPVLGP